MTEQLQFFSSLDFPGRSTLLLREIAEKIGCSVRHLCTQVEEGKLVVINIATFKTNRLAARVPIECYRDYVLTNLSGPVDLRMKFLATMPEATRQQLFIEVARSFPAAARKGLMHSLNEALR
jgi:hypothetical protein